MIKYSITVLPPREPNVKICSIFLNQQICTDFNISKKFIKIKKEPNMFIKIQLIDTDNMRNVGIDYPNLYLNSYIYEEDTKDYTKKYLKFKKDGVIIKPGDKDIKLKINLLRRDEVIDYCLIDIV
jgi:hypothetical protein